MKKLLTALGVLVALLGAALALGSLRWKPARRASPPRLERVARGAGPLRAGAAVVALAPPAPVPVAGFARLHWMEEGRRDPVAARAVVLEEPGCSVALVSMELLLVPGELQRAIERRVRDLGLDRVLVAATHTHAGPGGYWDEPLAERIATGPYREETFAFMADRAAEAIRKAAAALQPATLAVARGDARALVRNRGGAELDGRLVTARLETLAGDPVATLVVFPAHATLLGIENRLLSGDWPGALMRSGSDPMLFFQGALGDQSPKLPDGASNHPNAFARALLARIAQLPPGARDPWPELGFATAAAVLPPPVPGASPPLLRRIAANVIYDWMPARARVTVVRLGPLTLVAVPAEPVAAVGRRWRESAGDGAEVLALAGDYLGYVETSERMAEAAGETVRTYYGPELADRLDGAVRLAAGALLPLEAPQKRTAAAAPGAAPASRDR